MERFAVIGDIHSNLEAFTAVLDDIKTQGVNDIFSLGDTVGYNADPEPCLDMVIDNSITSLRGNHDRYVAGSSEIEPNIKQATRHAVEYTRDILDKNHRMLLNSFPDELNIGNSFLLVHGSPSHRDEYIITSDSVVKNLKAMVQKYSGINIAFFGHSHMPMIAGNGKILRKFPENRAFKLESDKVYLINPGSVGQPRDRVALASYALFTPELPAVEYRRIAYDIRTTQSKIVRAGLDQSIAARLSGGL